MAGIETLPIKALDTSLIRRFQAVRAATSGLASRLTAEDQMVQSCPEASPVKWHLAHSTWFFETFILTKYLAGYRLYNPDFSWLFNSYYKSLGDHPEKRLRASFSRPSLEQVLAYRRYVEEGIERLLEAGASPEADVCIELGMHHEQQHQELIVTDIKHAFWSNPLQPTYAEHLRPVYAERPQTLSAARTSGSHWFDYAGGLVQIGYSGEGFAFDNELSRHSVFLPPFRIASHLVTCVEYLSFIQDKGYQRPQWWLSDGWDTIQAQGWSAPLYWQFDTSGAWNVFTLQGVLPLDELLATPVCHLSYYEADAYARWANARLPTEFEWEHVSSGLYITGNFLEGGVLHPQTEAKGGNSPHPAQMFGDVWEWTQSAYSAYPRYQPAAGALGEYNGKFMCNQLVLRGGSVATPASHIRASYRNFFSPTTRWQFSGIRLAADGDAV